MTLRVFLSTSIPSVERHKQFWQTSDKVAIREAIKSLTAEIIHSKGQLIIGGRPAITPLVSFMFRHMSLNPKEHVVLYQSKLFAKEFPDENVDFPSQVLTDVIGDGGPENEQTREQSLLHMRTRMFEENEFSCAIFIGGMEGIFEEFELLRDMKPHIPRFPIASTGAAAAIAYDKYKFNDPLLKNELAYSTLFRNLFAQTNGHLKK